MNALESFSTDTDGTVCFRGKTIYANRKQQWTVLDLVNDVRRQQGLPPIEGEAESWRDREAML